MKRDEKEISFEQLRPYLPYVLQKTEVIQKNVMHKGPLEYEDADGKPFDEGKIYILIGGNILSEAYLEGLTVSYFIQVLAPTIRFCRWEDGLALEMDIAIFLVFG